MWESFLHCCARKGRAVFRQWLQRMIPATWGRHLAAQNKGGTAKTDDTFYYGWINVEIYIKCQQKNKSLLKNYNMLAQKSTIKTFSLALKIFF